MHLRPNSVFLPVSAKRRSGYTLVEILVATTLTLILMTAVVTVFGAVGDGIAKSRRAMEQFDRLRTTAQQLRLDLQGVTVTLDGRPARPEENQGYFEYIEGGILTVPNTQLNITSGTPQAINEQALTPSGSNDLTVGERGDILMFTTRNAARPFLGRYSPPNPVDSSNPTLQSDVAEVAWFLRGTTLHRRVLLVVPGVNQNTGFANLPPSTFFQNNDISVRLVNGQLVANSLGDLTRRENRFAHPANAFPFDARAWGLLGLPTLAECSSQAWMNNWAIGTTPLPTSVPPTPRTIDYWDNTSIASAFGITSGTASPDQYLALSAGGTCSRIADDVVLTNVIGFDVKVWEPAPNAPNNLPAPNAPNNPNPGYVDLGYGGGLPYPPFLPYQLANYTFPSGPTVQRFQHPGLYALSTYKSIAPNYKFSLAATLQNPQRVYDSGCSSYENEGIYHFNPANGKLVQDIAGGQSTNGLDDPVWPPDNNATNGTTPSSGPAVSNGLIDDIDEQITTMPYPVPLRGIQITIRCYEPDSRQIRQITIEHDFVPK